MTRLSIQPQDLYQSQWVSDPSVAPDGQIVYVHKRIDAESNQYRSTLRLLSADSKDDTPLTDGPADSAPSWSPDGRQIAFIRRTEGLPQLWIWSVKTQEATLALSMKKGIGTFSWSPSGKHIVLISREPFENGTGVHDDTRGRVLKRTTPRAEGSGWWDGQIGRVWLWQLGEPEAIRLTEDTVEASAPVWSPSGTSVAYLGQKIPSINNRHYTDPDEDRSPFNDLYTVDCSSGEVKCHTTHQYSISQINWLADESGWILIANDRTFGSGTQNTIYRLDAISQQCTELTPNMDIQFGNFILNDMKMCAARPGPTYGKDDTHIHVVGSYEGNAGLYKIQTDEVGHITLLTDGERDIHQIVYNPSRDSWITLEATPERPYELVEWFMNHHDDSSRPHQQVLTTHGSSWLNGKKVIIPQSFRYTNPEGQSVQSWIMKPEGKHHTGKLPLILQIHGGPHAMYSPVYSHEMQTLVSQGYMLLLVNPRGSFGYGQAFAQACRGDFGGGDYDDLMQAVDEVLAARDDIDEDKLGVCGGSYGGLMVNWIITHNERFHTAVSQRCISNWLSFYGTSDIGVSYTEGIVGGNPWEHAPKLWDRSPVAHAHNAAAPLLIIHGEQDLRCPVEQGEQMYTALHRNNKPVRMIRYAASNHGVLKSGKPSFRVDLLQQVNDWFHHWLQPSVKLSIPVGLWIENVLSSGWGAERLIDCIQRQEWQALLPHVADAQMDMQERLDTALELNEPWEDALRYGFSFTFIHVGGVRRLLAFGLGWREQEQYHWEHNHLYGLNLNAEQKSWLEQRIGSQWELVFESFTPYGSAVYELRLKHEQTFLWI
ncbi:S9 family peptidase [Paenibacillus sp. WLX2291]|uniref:S9 family peptidase n=1 Tax=Paenibacillus sp. WLX2291 TaxID=3296934 RepID=UPI0039841381